MLFWDEDSGIGTRHLGSFEKFSFILNQLVQNEEYKEFGGMWVSLCDKFNKGKEIERVIAAICGYLNILQVPDDKKLQEIIDYIKRIAPAKILENFIKSYLNSKNTGQVEKGLRGLFILLTYNQNWEYGCTVYEQAYINLQYKLNNQTALNDFLRYMDKLNPRTALEFLRDAINNTDGFTFGNAKEQLREQYMKIEDSYTALLFNQNNEEALDEFLGYVKGLPAEQANFLIIQTITEKNAFIWGAKRIFALYSQINLGPPACAI